MIRNLVAFLAGAAMSAAAAFLAGGGIRAGILIGAGLVILTLIAWPREAARALLATAEALTAFRAHWKTDLGSSPRPAMEYSTRNAAPVVTINTPTQIQADVKSALINLGMSPKKAARAAAETTAQDFESAFRQAQKAAA